MKRILLLLLLSFIFSYANAFQPEQFIIDELKRIAEQQQYEYHFYAGSKFLKELEIDEISESKLLDCLLQTSINSIPRIQKDFIPPKNVLESKLLANYIWNLQLLICMRNDQIIREKRTF